MQIRQRSGSPVEGLWILNPKVLGSSPGVLFSLKAIGLYLIVCDWKACAIIRFYLKLLNLRFIIKLERI